MREYLVAVNKKRHSFCVKAREGQTRPVRSKANDVVFSRVV